MADTKISDLSAVTVPAYGDQFAVNQGGTSKKTTLVQVYPQIMRALYADATGADSSSAQPWFPSTGAVSLIASGIYFFNGHLHFSRAAGGTSHTTGLLFGGTATLNGIHYFVETKEGDAATLSDSDLVPAHVATIINIKVASTSTTENAVWGVWGIVWVNAAGTLIPQFKFSAVPGGAPTIKAGTYFMMQLLGTGAAGISLGTWS